MSKSILTLCSIVLFAASTPQIASATTLTFESSNGGIYPYEMSINGSSSYTAMDCLNDTRRVTSLETWNVTAVNLKGLVGPLDGASVTQLDEQAWLDSLYGTNYHTAAGNASNTDIQKAIWDIQDSADDAGLTQIEKDLKAAAIAFSAANSYTSLFFAQFEIYVPTSNQYGWTRGEPQEFMQYTPSSSQVTATPEPSSLMLLGTGILGAAGLFRRRIAQAVSRS